MKKRIIFITLISTVICAMTLFIVLILKQGNNSELPSPSTDFYVNDYSNVYSDQTKTFVCEQANRLQKETQAQIVILTVPDTATYSLEKYSHNIANDWGIGDADLDNGVLILFTTKEAHVRLEIGAGLEGRLPDAKCGRILDSYAVPSMKEGNWDQAAIETWKAVAREVYAEYDRDVPKELFSNLSEEELTQIEQIGEKEKTEDDTKDNGQGGMTIFIALMVAAALVTILVLIAVFSKSSGSSSYSSSYSSSERSSRSSSSSSRSSGGGGSFHGGGASR